jgi:hypothetical protein
MHAEIDEVVERNESDIDDTSTDRRVNVEITSKKKHDYDSNTQKYRK